MKDITKITLGEFLSHDNKIIRNNAHSILKQMQKLRLNTPDNPKKPAHYHDWIPCGGYGEELYTCTTCNAIMSNKTN